MATVNEQLSEIQRALGAIEAHVEGLRLEQSTAASSRAKMYERLEEMRDEIAHVRSDVEMVRSEMRVSAQTAAQARDASQQAADKLREHAEKLDKHIQAVLPVLRRVRRLELRITLFIGAIGAAGATVWAVISSNAGAIWDFVRKFGS